MGPNRGPHRWSGLAGTGASPARAGPDRLSSIKSTSCQLRVSMLGKAVDCTSVAGIGYVQANIAGPGPGWAGSRARAWDGSRPAGAKIPSEGNVEGRYPYPHAWYEGLLAKLRKDTPAAHAAFTAARAESEKLVAAQPRSEKPLSVLALIDAQLGEKEKAIREGRTACDMLPPAKDAIDGVILMTNLAYVYALADEKDLALEQLATVSKLPFGPSYGELRLDPDWDWLRDDPRFEKIVGSLAPKKASP
jgi:hypothetical protein